MNESKMFSAKNRAVGHRITKSFGGWIAECERWDHWFCRAKKQRQPTLSNVANFLVDWTDFQQE